MESSQASLLMKWVALVAVMLTTGCDRQPTLRGPLAAELAADEADWTCEEWESMPVEGEPPFHVCDAIKNGILYRTTSDNRGQGVSVLMRWNAAGAIRFDSILTEMTGRYGVPGEG